MMINIKTTFLYFGPRTFPPLKHQTLVFLELKNLSLIFHSESLTLGQLNIFRFYISSFSHATYNHVKQILISFPAYMCLLDDFTQNLAKCILYVMLQIIA